MARGIKVSVVDQLIASKFAATEAQVENLARMNLSAVQTSENVRGIYLKVLVTGTQNEIDEARKAGASRKKAAIDAGAMLEQVHERYYAAVMKAVTTPDVADDVTLSQEDKTLRSLERNRRGIFARSARSTLASFIKAKGDVMSLDATKVTKRELQAYTDSQQQSAGTSQETLEHKTALAVSRVEEVARQLADADKDSAVQVVEEAMAKLANLLAEFGRDPTKSTVISIREHRPLRLDEGVFWPMARTSVPRTQGSVQ